MKSLLVALGFSLAVWAILFILIGWWTLAIYVALAFAIEARRRWKLRQLKKHPLYYLYLVQREFGER